MRVNRKKKGPYASHRMSPAKFAEGLFSVRNAEANFSASSNKQLTRKKSLDTIEVFCG